MSRKNILITGGAGFIGSNFVSLILNEDKNAHVINLDLLTYAGNLKNLEDVSDSQRYHFVKGDICDADLIEEIFKKYNITDVIHFAAESHVDNSIKKPSAFIKTNIEGTFNLLNQAYKTWMKEPNVVLESFKNSRFHHISTDEVYGALGKEGVFTEETPLAPNSPYSASKASADMIVRSYFKTFGLNVVTTNCSNNFGPKQHNEKLIPTIIRKAVSGENIPIYGKGENVRDWLFVTDHCEAIYNVFTSGKAGETYNIGGDCEITNIDICHKICSLLDQLKPKSDKTSYAEQITFVKDRPGHDFRYAISNKKISSELGWFPKMTFEDGLKQTINWYLSKLSASN